MTEIDTNNSPVSEWYKQSNYTYDANGNMISDGEFTFEYDAGNNMIKVWRGSNLVEEYVYDHSGNRIKKIENTSNGSITTYYISDLYELTVYPDGTKINTSYYYANGERVAKKAVNGSDSEVYYYHSDHLHSTSVVTRKGRLVAGTASVDSSWSSIDLNLNNDVSLRRPVVVAKIMSTNDTDNSEERISNVSSSSFELKVEETPAFDGIHATETFGYVALEEGKITDGSAVIGEAGTVEAGDVWSRVAFTEKFDAVPVIVASPMTTNNATQGVVRVRNIGLAGFDVRFEDYNGDYHPLETIGWMAIKPGTWTLDGKTIIASTANGITDSMSTVNFPQSFSSSPIVLSQIQSYNEHDEGSHTRVNSVTASGFDVKIEENNETDTHTAETIGYIALEPNTLKSGATKVSETKYYPYGVIQEGGNTNGAQIKKTATATHNLFKELPQSISSSLGLIRFSINYD